MAARRPLTRVGGKIKQLPSGDSLLGVPTYVQVTQFGGALLKISLNLSSVTLPIGLYGGGTLSVPVATNG